MIRCGLADVRDTKPAVSRKNPVYRCSLDSSRAAKPRQQFASLVKLEDPWGLPVRQKKERPLGNGSVSPWERVGSRVEPRRRRQHLPSGASPKGPVEASEGRGCGRDARAPGGHDPSRQQSRTLPNFERALLFQANQRTMLSGRCDPVAVDLSALVALCRPSCNFVDNSFVV